AAQLPADPAELAPALAQLVAKFAPVGAERVDRPRRGAAVQLEVAADDHAQLGRALAIDERGHATTARGDSRAGDLAADDRADGQVRRLGQLDARVAADRDANGVLGREGAGERGVD